ncbi:hypothetical protein PVL29_016583 [Vitis rotundifolia]|uniref:Uncharacterized protein n=1 Tax=Vitis rotundifolia TaxID=103349 RepID=A0AA38Z826_VITRO|nr:hypothetical protein PVL29_016569 [Vitis rotundifolia]KAJ9684152.1 hypothetical protein PVL29_016576 [Vitis rotundifolia]KAJ9684161.1 hypothetical protein PVL29_016583 [Vitis rotundifolia]
MVTDALVVKSLSTMSVVDLLNKSNINEVGGELEEKGVDSTMREALPVKTVTSLLTKKSKGLKMLKEAWLCEIFLENIAYTIAKKE